MLSPDMETIDHRVRIVMRFIEANGDRQLSLNEIAQSINVSPWHLCRLFKIATGTSVNQYLLGLRMERAKELLETTCMRVKEIMNQVGIRDESHFARTFKKLFGVSPSQYRALHRAQLPAAPTTTARSRNSLKAVANG
jgi:AraC-like DNA-binding protein